MANITKCTICDNEYSSYFAMWRHRKTKHADITTEKTNDSDIDPNLNETNEPIIFKCKNCDKEVSNKQNLVRHEKKYCKKIQPLPQTVININDNNESTINVIQQQNITINFNTLGNENVLDLTEKQKEEIINDGIDGIITLIKHLNFNKDIPQNHLFCTTNINNKYINALNLENKKVEKFRKFDFFEIVFKNSLKHMKILNNTIKDFDVQDKFEKKIADIEKKIFNYIEPVHMKIFHDDLNILSYNQRDIVRKTWEDSLSKNDTLQIE
jgi:hypothetical protein